MKMENFMCLVNEGFTQEQIVRELDLTEEEAIVMALQIQSWFDILYLEIDKYHLLGNRYYR